jgi:hypothetical protein
MYSITQFLAIIIENKNKKFSNFTKINSDTILINIKNDTDITVRHPDFNEIKKIILNPDFKNTIQVEIKDYFYDINYSYDPVRLTKKHKDIELYQDLKQISEIISNNDVKKINISNNLIKFTFENDIIRNYLIKGYNFTLNDFKIKDDYIILQLNTGIYKIIKHVNNFHLIKLAKPKIKYENEILGYTYSQIRNQCQQLPVEKCMNTNLSIEYKDKNISYNSKNFCRIINDECSARNNLDEMAFSYLEFQDFNF